MIRKLARLARGARLLPGFAPQIWNALCARTHHYQVFNYIAFRKRAIPPQLCTNSSGASAIAGYRKATHCMFDLDGTIVDSEATYHKILRQICKGFGANYSLELQQEVFGGTDNEICPTVVNRLKLPLTSDELKGKMRILNKKYSPISPLKKGAKRLLYHLNDHKIPIALVTNSTVEDVNLLVKVRPKLFSLFHHKVCSNDPDLARPKPYPDPYVLAAKRFTGSPKPEDCLVFEDSILGAKAALDAKMLVVLIPSNNLARNNGNFATIVIQSLLDFKPETFGLPPFTNRPSKEDNNKKN